MPSRGFFSWGKSRPHSIADPKITTLPHGDPRGDYPPHHPLHNSGIPGHHMITPHGANNLNKAIGVPHHRTSSQQDLSNPHDPTTRRNLRNATQFSSPLHNMPPYMQNIPPHLMPHFQQTPSRMPHGNNSRPHSVYWDQHNFPPQLLHDDRPGGRFVETPPGLPGQKPRYSSTFDVSAASAAKNIKSHDRNAQLHNKITNNTKPGSRAVSSSDLRYQSKGNLNESTPELVGPPLDPIASNGHPPPFKTLPPYWVPHEQLNDTLDGSSKGKYSKNKTGKTKNKKHDKSKENKLKSKDKKQKKIEKSNLSHEKKAKLYKSHEELRSNSEYDDKLQDIERMEKVLAVERMKKGGPKLGKLEKAQTLERLDNFDSLDDRQTGYFIRQDSVDGGLQPETRSIHEMREIQNGPSKEQLWMEEQERMRRSEENIAFRKGYGGKMNPSTNSLQHEGNRSLRSNASSLSHRDKSPTNEHGRIVEEFRENERIAYDESLRLQQDQEEILKREALLQSEARTKENERKQHEHQLNQLVSSSLNTFFFSMKLLNIYFI